MLESFISSPRIVLKRGEQRKFLLAVEERIGMERMAALCHCSMRTLRDWSREKFPMPLACAQLLSRTSNVPLPKRMQTRERYAHAKVAGLKGAQAVIKKYGKMQFDETTRNAAWKKWWDQEGKLSESPILQPKKIHTPRQSAELAEFFGILMGDGGISEYQVVISLHHVADLPYSRFVTRLIKRLFKLTPQTYHHPKNSVNYITISRKALVLYLHEHGLPIGNKVAQQFDIPDWIKKNRDYSIACVRGLIDTDGTIFTHSYIASGKRYNYKKLSFCSHSRPLQISVAKILADIGLNPRVTKYDVWLDSKADLKRYFALIGSHNPKHLKRYKN
ncbi:hypothetical protein C4568_03195 [Candidatus Parcubacteria bacterium]|nr:MAG: hypothetical protein C4568_03195 [Candidatus Parcubacteria bacterium]